MAQTHTVTMNWNDGGPALQGSAQLTDTSAQKLDLVVPTGTTDQPNAVAISATKTTMLYILSSVAITIKVNSSTAPIATLAIAAGIPFKWFVGCGFAWPFSADVATLYISNASGTQAQVKIRTLFHP